MPPPQEKPMSKKEHGIYKNFENHLKELKFKECDIKKISKAYKIGLIAHHGQERKTGGSFFEKHLLGTASILIDDCKIRDTNLIMAAFLHDIVEDTKKFVKKNQSWDELVKDAKIYLEHEFNQEVAEIVIAVTRPNIDNRQFTSRDATRNYYHERLQSPNFPIKARILKAADRLHNTMTPYDGNEEKQLKKLGETESIIIPILDADFGEFQEAGDYLCTQLIFEVGNLKTKLNLRKNQNSA